MIINKRNMKTTTKKKTNIVDDDIGQGSAKECYILKYILEEAMLFKMFNHQFINIFSRLKNMCYVIALALSWATPPENY